jgi:hypothetical protein
MPQSPAPPELPAGPDLPNFSDRLPDLTMVLRQAGRDLCDSKPAQTYLPYFEDVYQVAHSLKGVILILNCPEAMANFVLALNDTLLKTLCGREVCRRNKEAGELFLQLADLLDKESPAESVDPAKLSGWLPNLEGLFLADANHEERMVEIPPHLFYVNEFVSKRAREISLLGLNHTVVEDEILLDGIPLWRTQLQEALISPAFGRGVVVNFLPFLSSQGSRSLKLWAWVAAATHTRAALKQRIKEIMPKATLTKL